MQRPAQGGIVDPRLLLHQHHAEELVRPGAAVFLRHAHAQKAVLARLPPHRLVNVALLLPALVMRLDLGLEEASHAVAEGFVLGGK